MYLVLYSAFLCFYTQEKKEKRTGGAGRGRCYERGGFCRGGSGRGFSGRGRGGQGGGVGNVSRGGRKHSGTGGCDGGQGNIWGSKDSIPYTRKFSQYVYFTVIVPFRIFADKVLWMRVS